MTLKDLPNVTSATEYQDGHTPSSWQDGRQTNLFGAPVSPANRIPPQASKREQQIAATSGRISQGSSESVALASSLANRLVELLDSAGSTEYSLTWKRCRTAAGRQYLQQQARGRPTSGSDCTGWPTPTAQKQTPQSRDNACLARDCFLAGWPTPTVESGDQTSANPTPKQTGGDTLGGVAKLAGWPTPNTPSGGANTKSTATHTGGKDLEGEVLGLTPDSSPAPTEKRDGYPMELNPFFSAFLMGYPPEWGICGVRSAVSRLRKKSKGGSPCSEDTGTR